MAIDFHSSTNAGTYATRTASDTWVSQVCSIISPKGLYVADIGCGGGIYSTALAQMGADFVQGIDFSAQMVEDASARAKSLKLSNVSFLQAEACNTGLPQHTVDLVLQRALIHHLPSPADAFTEAHRILRPGGTLLVQDRMMEDVLMPSSPQHFRGYFFEAFPELLEVERRRRPKQETVTEALKDAGFNVEGIEQFTEERRVYADCAEITSDLLARTGRSLLHELSDDELAVLTDRICYEIGASSQGGFPIKEVDYWTVWHARA